jgi:hypothetical protein
LLSSFNDFQQAPLTLDQVYTVALYHFMHILLDACRRPPISNPESQLHPVGLLTMHNARCSMFKLWSGRSGRARWACWRAGRAGRACSARPLGVPGVLAGRAGWGRAGRDGRAGRAHWACSARRAGRANISSAPNRAC